MDQSAGDVYATMISDVLSREYDRKQSLEQRGLAVITTAGTLVSLIFGFAVFAGSKAIALPLPAKIMLGLGLIAFLIAAVLGLQINRPLSNYYAPVSVKDLRGAVQSGNWIAEPVEAARQVAVYQVDELDRWRNGNGVKANALHRAIAAETLGIALITGGILALIFSS